MYLFFPGGSGLVQQQKTKTSVGNCGCGRVQKQFPLETAGVWGALSFHAELVPNSDFLGHS